MKQLRIIYKSTLNWLQKLPPTTRNLIVFIILSIPVILYCLPFLSTGNNIAGGDADYLMQAQEAMRISVLKYGQFPWWNPWVSGGVPLFANPQFGLYSLPTLLSLFFGSIFGYKLALSLYLLIGFWGLYFLLKKSFNTPRYTAILLGYIWIFSSFFAQRITGHYTFFIILLFPLLLFVFLKRYDIKLSWLWLGLIIGTMINSATHYMTIMSLVVFSIFVFVELFNICIKTISKRIVSIEINWKINDLKILISSGVVAIILSIQKIYYSAEYLSQYPRSLPSSEDTVGVFKGLFAMFGPIRQYSDTPSIPNWSWMEISAYIGFATAIVAIICFMMFIRNKNLIKSNTNNKITPILIFVMCIIFFILGMGTFAGIFSPYSILHKLPIFSSMRVSTRWIIWSSLMVIFFISLYKKERYRKTINILLLLSVVELFILGSYFMPKPYFIGPAEYTDTSSAINQQYHYDTKRYGVPYDENLTAATQNNIGQVIAGDSLIDTRQGPPWGINTIRCDSDDIECNFVMTNNARVTYWSPNRITLKRTAPGSILLNMNPGKYWLVNGRYIFPTMRLAEPDKEFLISDKSDIIKIKIQPKFSMEWFIWKFTNSY